MSELRSCLLFIKNIVTVIISGYLVHSEPNTKICIHRTGSRFSREEEVAHLPEIRVGVAAWLPAGDGRFRVSSLLLLGNKDSAAALLTARCGRGSAAPSLGWWLQNFVLVQAKEAFMSSRNKRLKCTVNRILRTQQSN
jgi:hypothetical protein